MATPEHLLKRAEFDTNGGCLLWALSCGSHGYGQIVEGGVHELAHRASWIAHFGPIPDGLFVLHHCDVRPCIKPEHLFLGTEAMNTADMIAKGRGRPPPLMMGEGNPAATLTEAAVLEIRRAYAEDGVTQTWLAGRNGVLQPTISSIVRRESWAHL